MPDPMTIEEAECAFARLSKYVRWKPSGIQGGGGPVEHPNQGLLDDIRDLRQALTTMLAHAKARDEEVERWELVAQQAYRGRTINDREDLGSGYCGSCSYEIHKSQMQDPNSWVHSSVGRWLAVANRTALGGTP